jgi:hypothetical protein
MVSKKCQSSSVLAKIMFNNSPAAVKSSDRTAR